MRGCSRALARSQDDRTQEIRKHREAERLKVDEAEDIRILRSETLRKLKKALVGEKLAGRVIADDSPRHPQQGRQAGSPSSSTSWRPRYGVSCGSRTISAQATATAALQAMTTNVEAIQAHYGAKQDRLKRATNSPPASSR